MRPSMRRLASVCIVAVAGCQTTTPSPPPSAAAGSPQPRSTPTVAPSRLEHTGTGPSVAGTPIAITELSGRIVFDDFEDLFAMDVDGSHVVKLASSSAGPEFDGSWSPGGSAVVYRDSTRGINDDDELFVVESDGTGRRNLTNDPGNDWGPDWSPDGSTIAFNSDRAGGAMGGYLMDAAGGNLRRIDVAAWIEYPSWSPDGRHLAFMGAIGNNYELFTIDLDTLVVTRLTDSPGHDAWPAWSPDGRTIAFSSVRDDCRFAARAAECWRTGDEDPYHDIWLIDPDGDHLRRATPELGQFVAWSPDGAYLLISGQALYVIRPDGTGRIELRADGISRALGGIPDWTD